MSKSDDKKILSLEENNLPAREEILLEEKVPEKTETKVEKIKIPERIEEGIGRTANVPAPVKEEEEEEIASAPLVLPTIPSTEKSETLLAIEKILEEDLKDVYQSLPEYLRPEFKKKGEETAFKIEKILKAVKIKIKEIVKIIKEWLRIVPGINKFFIEKEAKIKAEKIVKFSKKDE